MMIINGYRFWGLFKASNHNSKLPETYLLTMASTCIEKQNFCHQLQHQKKVYITARTAPDQCVSTFSLLGCRPNSFKVWQSAFRLTKVLKSQWEASCRVHVTAQSPDAAPYILSRKQLLCQWPEDLYSKSVFIPSDAQVETVCRTSSPPLLYGNIHVCSAEELLLI